MADPAPMPEVARYPVPSQNHGECQANGTCLGSTGAPPAIFQSRHAPALSCDWRGGWRTDKHSAAAPHRTRGSPCFGACAHVHRFGGEPDGVNADHRKRSRRKVAQAAALSAGQFTLMVPRRCCISTQIFDDAGWEFAPASGMGNGINVGGSAGLFCSFSRIHLWTRFALRLWPSATLAIEAPGCAHS